MWRWLHRTSPPVIAKSSPVRAIASGTLALCWGTSRHDVGLRSSCLTMRGLLLLGQRPRGRRRPAASCSIRFARRSECATIAAAPNARTRTGSAGSFSFTTSGIPRVWDAQTAGFLIGLFLLGFAARFLLTGAVPFLADMSPDHLGGLSPRRRWLATHIAGGSLALLAGPFQFWSGLRRRSMLIHRWTEQTLSDWRARRRMCRLLPCFSNGARRLAGIQLRDPGRRVVGHDWPGVPRDSTR